MEAVSVHRFMSDAANAHRADSNVRRIDGDVATLHHRPIAALAGVEVLAISRAAVVLGSTQAQDIVNVDRANDQGFDVVRRRSGGGIVILQPHDHVWIDVTVPRGHPLWHDDVERATWWVGEVWCDVLQQVDATPSWRVHRDKLAASALERSVCFAAVGPGEVLRSESGSEAGRKVVGISQRRTKDAARFQCTLFRAINIALHETLLAIAVPATLRDACGVGDALDDVGHRAAVALATKLG